MERLDLDLRLRPTGGWPGWVTHAPYRSQAHPQAADLGPLESGANCQRYAYAVLALFERFVPALRSSELWEAPAFSHPDRACAEDLDLVLFNHSEASWGAHVAVILGGELLHLCAEERRPALWSWNEFPTRPRYAHVVGLVRVPRKRSVYEAALVRCPLQGSKRQRPSTRG